MTYYIKETEKTVAQAATDLEAAVANNKFGTLHIHKISDILKSKGLEPKEECQVFEVCNPGQAFKVMEIEMQMNMALPCRISVYTEGGKTKIGMISPKIILSMLSDNADLLKIATEVDDIMQNIINEAV